MKDKNEHVFVTIFSFFVLFIPFTYHGAASEAGDDQYEEMIRLKKKALEFGENGTALSYELRKDAWYWATTDNFSFHDGMVVGIIGGAILSALTCIFLSLLNRVKRMREISNFTLFICTIIPVVASFSIYEILAKIFDKHLMYSPIDVGIVGCYSFLLGLIIFLHYFLKKRIESLENRSVRYFGSKLKLEHETWKQILSSIVYATLLIFGTVLVSVFTSTNELKDLLAINNAIFFVGMMMVVLVTFFFGIYFGVYCRLISHLNEITDLL